MLYEGNPKHKHPWQCGKKGSLCPKSMSVNPQDLLDRSVLWLDGKRYSTCDGRCYCAQEHRPDHWHGYPIGWLEVPELLRRQWRDTGEISKQDISKNW
jgi:hypothetical protein